MPRPHQGAGQLGSWRGLSSWLADGCCLDVCSRDLVFICFEVLSNFPHQTLEGRFANQKFSGLLITSNFPECHGTRPVTMRFLHPSTAFVASCFLGALPPVYFRAVCFRRSWSWRAVAARRRLRTQGVPS
ncbi:hypothetical protein Cadr_000000259 [Camelus dromedarius]|uniref:Uncharacterized protein n=1 Tax=Camelus dromedarius TaxID=9838 RepID=A0A5N4EIN7_CAMDR|nr:hypothetical protein Cadr_000000259 [Camelus dromedarius]